ncbi:phosphatidylglycerophosphatase A [Candidatus Dependentiae bacterium]|nr:phosphatidylglycerophosphatase A [Candidatus Dependentiae bacterium]
MKQLFSFWALLATLGPCGYFIFPGTVGTLATVPLVYFLGQLNLNIVAYTFVTFIIFLVSFPIVDRALALLDNGNDPSEIVIDELVGFLITFIGIEVTPQRILIGFFLFRFFDITKFFGINRIELMHGARGVILDDVVAGIYSNIVLHLLIYFGRYVV